MKFTQVYASLFIIGLFLAVLYSSNQALNGDQLQTLYRGYLAAHQGTCIGCIALCRRDASGSRRWSVGKIFTSSGWQARYITGRHSIFISTHVSQSLTCVLGAVLQLLWHIHSSDRNPNWNINFNFWNSQSCSFPHWFVGWYFRGSDSRRWSVTS